MALPSTPLLLVEDDPLLRRNVRKGLMDQGYTVVATDSIEEARHHLGQASILLVILDLGLPDGHGLDLLADLRKTGSKVPVIILTARDALADKVAGLDLGADDYLVKPFDFQELSARIRAHLRRAGEQLSSTLAVADLTIDLVARSVARGGHPIDCTPREFDVLVYLARTPGQPVSRHMLMTEVWKVQSRMTSMDNVIDVLMSRLREKVDRGHAVTLLHTVRGIGFVLKEPA